MVPVWLQFPRSTARRSSPVGLGDLVGGVVGEFRDDVAREAQGEADLGVAEDLNVDPGGYVY